MEELHVGTDLFAEVKGELDDGHELGEDVCGIGAIGTFEDCGKYAFELVVIDALEIVAISILEDPVSYIEANFCSDDLVVPSFALMMAWWMRFRLT